ncbi:Deoxycytidine triphosphate deaminase [Alteromonas mediterranea UM4b]|nr:Deoxycytidine triphosphate deaminase [Alteromonas mediterranea UM4b]
MILADFCRNCLAKWYSAAASEQGADIDYEAAREVVYKMPYSSGKRSTSFLLLMSSWRSWLLGRRSSF